MSKAPYIDRESATNWDNTIKYVNQMTRGYGLEFSHSEKYLQVRMLLPDGRTIEHGNHKKDISLESMRSGTPIINLILESVFSGRMKESLMEIASDYAVK